MEHLVSDERVNLKKMLPQKLKKKKKEKEGGWERQKEEGNIIIFLELYL